MSLVIANEGTIPFSCKTQAMAFCSVCLDAVVDGGERSIARLKCGHQFHLDCIGSAFNAKGRMQCPNCRQVEPGRWLYTNACCLHEDFVEDFSFEEDTEVYSAAAQMQFSHMPWCPHHGLYEQFSLTLEELDSFRNGYLDPIHTVAHGLQAPFVNGGQICPYLLAAQSFLVGRPSNQVENFIRSHVGHLHRDNGSMRDTNRGLQTGVALSASNGSRTSFGGFSHNNNAIGQFLQPHVRHLTLGFLTGSAQPAQAGLGQRTNFTGNDQRISGHTHSHPTSLSQNGQAHIRRPRHADVPQLAQRNLHVSASGRGQINELAQGYHSWGVLYQNPNQVFHEDGYVYPWRGVSFPSLAYGTPGHWWAWAPAETHHMQRPTRTASPHAYHEGHFSGLSRYSMSRARFSQHTSEAPYTWVFSGL